MKTIGLLALDLFALFLVGFYWCTGTTRRTRTKDADPPRIYDDYGDGYTCDEEATLGINLTYDYRGNLARVWAQIPLVYMSGGRAGTTSISYTKTRWGWVGPDNFAGAFCGVSIDADGVVRLYTSSGIRTFDPNGCYVRGGFQSGSTTRKDGSSGFWYRDNAGWQVVQDSNHKVEVVTLSYQGKKQTHLVRTGLKSWQLTIDHLQYAWNGTITATMVAGSNIPATLQFRPDGGKPFDVTAQDGSDEVVVHLRQGLGAQTHSAIESGHAYVRVDEANNVFIKCVGYCRVYVNGTEHEDQAAEVRITADDVLQAEFEYSDRDPEWDKVPLCLGVGENGRPTINGQSFGQSGVLDLWSLYRPAKVA